MKVQEKIREIMDEKKMKQGKVAEAAGLIQKEFSAMLCGRKLIRPENVLPICEALEITPNDLFGASADAG